MVGRTLAHYEILQLLGVGGMGEVYLAEDTKLGRKVALKLLRTDTSKDSSLRGRLEQEARAIASLQHPNIVTLFSVEEAQGQVFLTMELVRGQQLSEFIVEGGMDAARFLELALPLTDAVGAAHSKGVVHRDLKPSNVVFDESGRLKILDFGLAKQLQSPGSLDDATVQTSLTTEGTIVGTCAYMSPEQAEGHEVDARSDVFSLGILLYEIATGRKPFEGTSPISVISSILKDKPVPVDQLSPSLPTRLARIVQRCLEKDPERRWTNAVELHRELTSLKESLGPGAVPPRQPEGHAPQTARAVRRTWFALPVILVLGLLLWQRFVGNRDERPQGADPATRMRNIIVVFPFENLGGAEDTYFTEGMTDEIVSRLTAVRGIGVISRTTAMRYDRADKTLAQIGDDLGVNFVLEGTIRWDRHTESAGRVRITPQLVRVGDRVSVWSQTFDREISDVFAIQSEIAHQVVSNVDASLMPTEAAGAASRRTENLEAYDYYLQAKPLMQWGMGPSEMELRRAADLLEKAIALDPDFASAHAGLSQVNSAMHFREYDASEARLVLAERAATRAVQLDSNLPEAHLAQGLFHYRSARDYERALESLDVARRLAPGSGEILSWIGTMHKRQGRFDEGVAILEQAIRLDPYNPLIPSELAVVHRQRGDFGKALESIDQVIALEPSFAAKRFKATILLKWKGDLAPLRTLLEQSGPGYERAWAELLAMERKFGEALTMLDAVRPDPSGDPFAFTGVALARARLHWVQGDSAAAGDAVEDVVPLLERLVQRNAYSNARLGLSYAFRGRREEAVQQARLALQSPPVAKDALMAATVMEHVAEIHAVIGDIPSAVSWLDRVMDQSADYTAHDLRLSFVWDPIRDHPEFRALERRAEARQ